MELVFCVLYLFMGWCKVFLLVRNFLILKDCNLVKIGLKKKEYIGLYD